jgi:hypothetical protein
MLQLSTVTRYVELERYALISTGAIWSWLAGITSADWDPALKWLPFGINLFFFIRAIGLIFRTREIGRYLADAEEYFVVPTKLALEGRYNPWGLKMITVWSFWVALLLATAVLPYIYGNPTASAHIWPA